jgi:hypothetical protein
MDAQPPRESWPPHEQVQELFARLLANGPVAHADFTEAFLEPLVAHLRRTNSADEHFLLEAAEDAVMSLLKRYDPARSSLESYLRMSAAGDLRNILTRERRHHCKRENVDPVELGEIAGKSVDESEEGPTFDHPVLAAVLAEFGDGERAVFELMRDGVRDTAAFAAALGVTDRTPDEQFAAVKRVKDRIKVRLKRAVEGP